MRYTTIRIRRVTNLKVRRIINQEEGNLVDHQWDSKEGEQIHYGERASTATNKSGHGEKFDVENLFRNKNRCNPRCDDKYFAKICAGGEQHFD